MQVLILMVALSEAITANNIPSNWTPNWQNDYRQAKLQASEAGKPLAVFVGSGKNGWEAIAREGTIDETVARTLKNSYVCLYIDMETAAGRKLAAEFEITGKGLVISDRKGDLQAFSHNGDLSQAEMARTFVKYAEADRAVVQTETVAPVQRYQPTPTIIYGDCPNCRR